MLGGRTRTNCGKTIIKTVHGSTGIDVSGSDVNVRMTMTTQGCPLHETMVQDVKRYAKKVPGVANVNVDVVWDPPWTMDKLSDDAKETLKKMGTGVGLSTPAPVNYETALAGNGKSGKTRRWFHGFGKRARAGFYG